MFFTIFFQSCMFLNSKEMKFYQMINWKQTRRSRHHQSKSNKIHKKLSLIWIERNKKITFELTWPVSVSNLYSRMAGLFDPTSIFRGVIDGAIMIQLTGLPWMRIEHKRKYDMDSDLKKLLFLLLFPFPFPLIFILHSFFFSRIKQLTNEKYIFKTFHFFLLLPPAHSTSLWWSWKELDNWIV